MSDLPIETQTEAQAFSEALQAFGLSTGATDAMDFVDHVERCIVENDRPQECAVGHAWTPGLYGRTCLIPKGTILTSKIHKTEHQFVILKGEISVWTKEQGVVTYQAPHHGITQPDTRRILFAHEDTIWITFHATDKNDVAAIEDDIIMKHDNQYLTGGAK